jgi:outer membrane protein
MARGSYARLAALAMALAPVPAAATTLDEAIALALKHDPGLKRAQAEHEAAKARLDQAKAGRLPTVSLHASISEAPTNFGNFFGFGESTLTPRSAGVELREPIFRGGALVAAVGEAKAAEAGAAYAYDNVRLGLAADVAEAFEAVRVDETALALRRRQTDELALIAKQAERKFEAGEAPKTDVNEAEARAAAAQADVARSEGDVAVATAKYREVVGADPVGLEPPSALPQTPASVDEAVAAATSGNPGLAAAQAQVSAADEAVRRAKADRAPAVDLVAGAASVRDEFLPGYKADSASVGVEGRWTVFSSGLAAGKIHEAAANRNAAEASLDQARAQVEEAAIEAWHALDTARAVSVAAEAQSRSADAALANVREEVRVGQKPTLDLLDAEREALSARLEALRAEAATVVAAYRLKAAMGS